MKLGLNSWTTGDGVDLPTDISVAARAGYELLEIKQSKIEAALAAGLDLPKIAEMLRRAGLSILNVNTLDQATLAEGPELEALATRCRAMCGYAAALGAPYVLIGPTYLDDGEARDRAGIRVRTIGALRRYADQARAAGVKIAFEFHGYARASINTLAETLELFDRLNDPDIALVVDTFHFYVGGSALADLRRLPPDRLAAVHLADVDHEDRATLGRDNRVLPGAGVMPIRSMTATLAEAGYAGPYTIELFRQDYWAMDPAVVAAKGITAMRSVL
ncbi:MAG: sugar phosphate isomerase/epimerase [Acetobacteraceae bacterium]|nr:sugar phosphate isomerase/epimerase [Acetobacteraceae bacterium]